ncbi:MAG: hypothetical protein AB7I12_00080 [Steroidobacteraceae bacterium]
MPTTECEAVLIWMLTGGSDWFLANGFDLAELLTNIDSDPQAP